MAPQLPPTYLETAVATVVVVVWLLSPNALHVDLELLFGISQEFRVVIGIVRDAVCPILLKT